MAIHCWSAAFKVIFCTLQPGFEFCGYKCCWSLLMLFLPACGKCLQALCKAVLKYNSTWASLRNLSALGRSPSRPHVIKRLKPVKLHSETQFDTRRQEGCSLQMSTVQNSHPLTKTVPCYPAFLRSCGQGVITKAASPRVWDFCPRNVCAFPLFPWGLSVYKTLRSPKLLYLHLTPLWIAD